MENIEKYDAIIIGSGIGALTLASILSKLNNKKVLIFEKHWKGGGQTHEFKRKGKFRWDVGLHYVGQMGKGESGKAFFDYVTDKKLKWNKIPSPFERFIFPDFTFEVPDNNKDFQSKLIEMFPHEKKSIERYFKDLKKATRWSSFYFMSKLFPIPFSNIFNLIASLDEKLALSTVKEYLDRNFKNEKLKAILVAQWGDYGLTPKDASFAMHSMLVTHFINGAYFPEGGSGEIFKTILPIIEKNAGKIITSAEVTEIIIKNNEAIGVKVKQKIENTFQEKEYYAPIIISDIGVLNTYNKLIPQTVEIPFREYIKNFKKGCSVVITFIGFKDDPRKIGLESKNYWMYEGYNPDEDIKNQDLVKNKIYQAYLSLPSLKDSTATNHTAEILTFMEYDYFEKWKNQEWLKRDEEYYSIKEKIGNNLVDFVEKHFDGFKDLIEYKEVSTPLTMEFFTNWENGAMYGIPSTPERYKKDWMGVKTPIKNLYMTGTDASGAGIMGAMFGGIATASILNGYFGIFKVMRAIFKKQK